MQGEARSARTQGRRLRFWRLSASAGPGQRLAREELAAELGSLCIVVETAALAQVPLGTPDDLREEVLDLLVARRCKRDEARRMLRPLAVRDEEPVRDEDVEVIGKLERGVEALDERDGATAVGSARALAQRPSVATVPAPEPGIGDLPPAGSHGELKRLVLFSETNILTFQMAFQRTQNSHAAEAASDLLPHREPAQSLTSRDTNGKAADRVVSGLLAQGAATGPAAEELAIHEAFLQAMGELEKDGDRLAYHGPAAGVVNNLVGTVMVIPDAAGMNVTPPMGCQGQSILIAPKLGMLKQFRDWKLQKRSSYDPNDTMRLLPFSGYHWVVKATSPTGRAYLLDSNQGKFGAWGDLDKRFWYTE